MTDAIRYQEKWAGGFGDDYQSRNEVGAFERVDIWGLLLGQISFHSVLEVGCSRGHNLRCIKSNFNCDAMGIEINEKAIRERYVDTIVKGSAYSLPFVDKQFDLVLTAGVLIHLSDTIAAMREIYRTAKKYIISVEYFTDKEREINYRDDVYCYAKDFKKLWLDNFPDLKVVEEGNTKDFGITVSEDDFSTACGYIILKK